MRRQAGGYQFIGSFTDDLPDPGLCEIAFAGRSNVGKSSALNRLLNTKKAARVSQRPGRTQAINLFKIGDACVFADLPGYGYARVPTAVKDAWKVHIERYFAERERLRLTVLFVDVRRDPMAQDRELVAGLLEAGLTVAVVATKADKLKKQVLAKQLSALQKAFSLPGKPIAFSSVDGRGRDEVWDLIELACKEGR